MGKSGEKRSQEQNKELDAKGSMQKGINQMKKKKDNKSS